MSVDANEGGKDEGEYVEGRRKLTKEEWGAKFEKGAEGLGSAISVVVSLASLLSLMVAMSVTLVVLSVGFVAVLRVVPAAGSERRKKGDEGKGDDECE
jgi:hypothetical protein